MVNVLVILMVVAGVRTMSCPNMCTCREYPRESFQKNTLYFTETYCEGYSRNFVYSLDNTTKDLILSNFKESELINFFKNFITTHNKFSFLNNLVVRKSEITPNLIPSAADLQTINSLSLVNNYLSTVPEFLSKFSNLHTLDLSENIIKNTVQPFKALKTLQVLNLSGNSMRTINETCFAGLADLKSLDLSFNKLRTIDNKLFSPLTSLKYLNLTNNALEHLTEVMFSRLVHLQQLDVASNDLSRIEPGCLQLPSLTRIVLADNFRLGQENNADALLLSSGRRLQNIDVSRVGLRQVPATITHSIRTLRLDQNYILTIHSGDFDSYPLLQLLDLSRNTLTIVEDDAFGRLEALTILNLSSNKISEIPKSLPVKLKILHLEANKIKYIFKDDLQGLSALEVLILSDNAIETLEEAAFSPLISLVTLDLSRNPFTSLQPGFLLGPTALQVLRLQNIGMLTPALDASFPLLSTEHLIILDLQGSVGLAQQFLADTAALAAARELQELNVGNAELEVIRADLLHYLPQLRILHLTRNKLNCTGMQWLASWMRRQDEIEYKMIRCNEPPELRGTPLIEIQEEYSEEITLTPKIKYFNNQEINNYNDSTKTNSVNLNVTNSEITEVPNLTTVTYTRQFEKYLLTKNNFSVGVTDPNSIKIKLANDTESVPAKLNNNNSDAETPLRNDSTNYLNKKAIMLNRNVNKSQTNSGILLSDNNKKKNLTNYSINTKNVNRTLTLQEPTTLYPVLSLTIDETMTVNSSQWNNTAGEMSMYKTNNDHTVNLLHPGMLILATCILSISAVLVMLATRFTRQRRRNSRLVHHEENIEVSSLPSVTELW